MLDYYEDLAAPVRPDGRYHLIKGLVQPQDPLVREVAAKLAQAPDFVEAVHAFVHAFTTYERERVENWRPPRETLARRAGDCDDKAILLASLLRNRIPADQVFVGIGTWSDNGRPGGHAWVVMQGEGDEDRVLEATADSSRALHGEYRLSAIFNDRYAFSTPEGLAEFDLVPAE